MKLGSMNSAASSPQSKLISAVRAFLLGLCYAAIIAALAALMGGAGHGWSAVSISSVGLALIPSANTARHYLHTNIGRFVSFTLLLAAGIADVLIVKETLAEGLGYVERTISAVPLMFLVWLVLWVGWQLVFLSQCLIPSPGRVAS